MLRPSTQRYSVTRPLYSEDAFEDEHAKVYRKHKRFLHHVIQYFTCTSERAKNTAISLLPIIGWMKTYSIKDWLLNDILSGVSTGLVAVLQGLAFSLLASISTWYGLYAAFFPVIMYFFLGTSRHISVASFVQQWCGVSYAFNFSENHGVDVVEKIPNTFESPITPSLQVFQMTAVEAFPIAIVGFAVAFAVAKVYSVKHDYVIDGNQELIAFGASNIFGGAFKSLAASTALSRSAVQESTGGKTQVAGLLSAIIVLVVILGIGFLLEPLPKSVLGAVVIVNLKGMLMQVVTVPYLWKKDRPDCIVWVGTCLAAIFLGLDLGLAVGLGLELLTVVFRAQFPRCCVLANISGTDIYRDRKDYVNIYEPEGVKIFRIPSPIFFANIDFFRDKLKDAVGFNPLRILRKRNKAVKKMKKLIKKGELTLTSNGLQATCSMPIEESEDESNMEDLDKPTDYSDLPVQVNWNAELPANIRVPPVNIHSLILDFSVVSFLDISALKGLKAAIKEFIRINVDVYIVGCDPYIIEKPRNCTFFDDEIKTSIFFLTIHDAMLFIHESHPPKTVSEKVSGSVQYQHVNSSSTSSWLTIQADMKMEVETDTKPETRF
ncbi:chloride anion exchanger-like [Sinocyclocheilus rhinocerous]|uniref:chloride anion exchanger-like n=1 Tax=Sinocyclocheilus rhinocerous TaxID=307959 RepID=UPI0007B7F804|nr:PREDICTED: chloride anion exchanger-like [Sinocyclocheilus rhinocerous]